MAVVNISYPYASTCGNAVTFVYLYPAKQLHIEIPRHVSYNIYSAQIEKLTSSNTLFYTHCMCNNRAKFEIKSESSSPVHSTVYRLPLEDFYAYCVCHVFVEFDTIGGVAYAEMLGRSNLLAIVGGGQAPKFPDRNGTVVYEVVAAGIRCDLGIVTVPSLIQ
jgi:hypothetical protein